LYGKFRGVYGKSIKVDGKFREVYGKSIKEDEKMGGCMENLEGYMKIDKG